MLLLQCRCGSVFGVTVLRKQEFSTSHHLYKSVSWLQADYDVLGIPVTSSKKDIKSAYFEKAKLLHPDISRYDCL